MSRAPGTGEIRATVVYARPDRQWVVELVLPAGATLADAVRAAGLEAQCPELAALRAEVGVFHRRLPPHSAVRDGDRIELYRPLQIDPKEARRLRASGARRTAQGKKTLGGQGP